MPESAIDLESRLTGAQLIEVTQLSAIALGYAWGIQDGAGSGTDSNEALSFSQAYKLHATEYALELRTWRQNIRDAYRQFSAGKPIGE